MKIIALFQWLVHLPEKVYKNYHRIRSKGRGMKYVKIINTGERDERGKIIFKAGKTGITYSTEPKFKRARRELIKFQKFIEKVRKLPPGDHPFWFRKFNI